MKILYIEILTIPHQPLIHVCNVIRIPITPANAGSVLPTARQ